MLYAGDFLVESYVYLCMSFRAFFGVSPMLSFSYAPRHYTYVPSQCEIQIRSPVSQCIWRWTTCLFKSEKMNEKLSGWGNGWGWLQHNGLNRIFFISQHMNECVVHGDTYAFIITCEHRRSALIPIGVCFMHFF